MSEASRKRSRKSKLVPRDCAVNEDDIELQVPSTTLYKSVTQYTKEGTPTTSVVVVRDKSVLDKINAPAKEIKTEPTTRKFEIDVEVESCDDEFNTETYDTDSDRLSPINKYPRVNGIKSENVEIRKVPIILTHENILDETNNILNSATNIADKILGFCVKNTIGFEVERKLDEGLHEHRLQKALDAWRTWQFRSFHRECPLFYKCYICVKSWWHLSDFRDHISQHPHLTIALESKIKYLLHECNIVAYQPSTKLGSVINIHTDGLCFRCGKDFDAHARKSRILQKYYGNEGCTKQFYTCIGSRDHVLHCDQCNVKDKLFNCIVCKSKFDTVSQLKDHLELCHLVRSDLPIMSRYKICKYCSERYSCSYLHKCGKKGLRSQCPHCFKSFANRMLMEVHLDNSKQTYKCEICEEDLVWSCQKYEHMMVHTDNFTMIRRCIKCKGWKVFLNNESTVMHRILHHDSRHPKHQGYFPKILVPKSCIYSSLEESEKIQSESVLEPQESVPELRKPKSESNSESVLVCNKEPPFLKSVKKTEYIRIEKIPIYIKGSELDFHEDDVIVKEEPADIDDSPQFAEEPEDIDDSPRLVIKEEPADEFETHEYTNEEMESLVPQVIVKEEITEEEEEYEDDIIKLNINIEDLLAKQGSSQTSNQESIDENPESDEDPDNAESFSDQPIKEESLPEPEVDWLGNPKRLYKCTQCGFKARHREYKDHVENDCLRATIKSKRYRCIKCNIAYTTMRKFLIHFINHGYRPLSCPECLKQFTCTTKLGPHVVSHVKNSFVRVKLITTQGATRKKPDNQCTKCGEITDMKDFFDHWTSHISEYSSSKKWVYPSEARLSRLGGEIDGGVLKEFINGLYKMPKDCTKCHRHFNRVSECKRHIIEHLLTDAYSQKHIHGDLKCQICGAGHPNAEKYKSHMRDHAHLPVYKCELCDRTFSDSSNFTKHKKVHNLKVSVCDLCGKKFQAKESLAKHIEIHKTTEPITCIPCNKVFYFDSSYRRHVRHFHERVTMGFRCIICGERFETLKHKWDHMWLVHKERKNKADCPICSKSFRKYSDVRSHAKKDHNMEVSLLSVKNATKSMVDIAQFLKKSNHLKIGRDETLVVYDPDT